MLFLGLAGYIGDQRGVQSFKGAMLSMPIQNIPVLPAVISQVIAHVTDSKSWTAPKESRHGVYTNSSLVR